MPWVKLDDGFYSNPKVIKVPPLARSLYVAGLCHCASGLTDGQITKAALPLLTAQTGAPRNAAAALVDVGLWHDGGDHYAVNDWAHFNQTAADISERRKAEREKKAAQRAAAAKKAIKGPNGQFVSPGDNQGDNSRDNRRDSPRDSPATRPDPTYLSTSSNNSSGVGPSASNPEEDQPPNPDTPEARTQAAIEHMARCDLRAQGSAVKHPDSWLTKAVATRTAQLGRQILEDAHEHPDASPVDLAERADPACGPDDGGLARALASAAKVDQAAADAAQFRADRARAQEILHTIDGPDLEHLEQLADTHLASIGLQPGDPTHRITRKATLEALALEHHGTTTA